MSADSLNQLLHDLYVDQLPSIHEAIRRHVNEEQMMHMHGPFMMHVYPEYTTASKKLMFVGMETHTWKKYNPNEEHNVAHQRLTHSYREFINKGEHLNSPFWWFIKDLSNSYGQTDYTKAALWTNLSKIDIKGKRPTGKVYDNTMQSFLSLLVQEVGIVKPNILVLMTTDPNYQWHLSEKFGLTAGLSKCESLIPKQLFRWVTDVLPVNTFQIYHPNRLRFTPGGYKQNAEQIIQSIQQRAQ